MMRMEEDHRFVDREVFVDRVDLEDNRVDQQ